MSSAIDIPHGVPYGRTTMETMQELMIRRPELIPIYRNWGNPEKFFNSTKEP